MATFYYLHTMIHHGPQGVYKKDELTKALNNFNYDRHNWLGIQITMYSGVTDIHYEINKHGFANLYINDQAGVTPLNDSQIKTFCHSHQIRTHMASNSRNCLNSEKDDNDLFALRCTINSQNLEKLMNLTDLSSLDYSGKELNNFFLLLYLKCLTTNYYKLYNQNTLSFFDWQIFAVKINDKLYLLSKPTNEDSLFGPYRLHIENPINPTNFKNHIKFQQLGDPLPLNSVVDNLDKLQDDYHKIENSIFNTKTWLATNY